MPQIKICRHASLRSLFPIITLVFLIQMWSGVAQAKECDLLGGPTMTRNGTNQVNCNFVTAVDGLRFIELQEAAISGISAEIVSVENRLKGFSEAMSKLPLRDVLDATDLLPEKIAAWNSKKRELELRVYAARDAAKAALFQGITTRDEATLTFSLYKWLVVDNREQLNEEVRTSGIPRQKAKLVSFDIQVSNTESGFPIYIRTTVKSITPYMLLASFSSYEDGIGPRPIKKMYMEGIDRRDTLGSGYINAAQSSQGVKRTFNDYLDLDVTGFLALIERRWVVGDELFETWLSKIDFQDENLGAVQLSIHDWGSTGCLRIVLAESYHGGTGCSSDLRMLNRNEVINLSKVNLESEFRALFQIYQKSQYLAHQLRQTHVNYPETFLLSLDELTTQIDAFEMETLNLESEVKDKRRKQSEVLAKQTSSTKALKATKTIVCVKGKLTWKLSAKSSTCPQGYKKK